MASFVTFATALTVSITWKMRKPEIWQSGLVLNGIRMLSGKPLKFSKKVKTLFVNTVRLCVYRPKIGKAKDTTGDVLRKHTKGCNCKRSGCLKNYCECYEAKIACSNNCKCIGCRNVEDSLDRKKFSMASDTQRMTSDELTQTVYRKILPYYKEMNTYSPIRHRKSSLFR